MINAFQELLLAFASRLAFLTLDYFIAVSDAVAVVGFGYSDFADIRSGLTDKSFIDARNDDFVYCGTFELDACGFGEVNGVRKAYVETILLPCLATFQPTPFTFNDFV